MVLTSFTELLFSLFKSRRSKRDRPRPFVFAIGDITVGGNCLGSPTNTTRRGRYLKGIRQEGSVHCPASSIITESMLCFSWKFFLLNVVDLIVVVVAVVVIHYNTT